MPEGLEAKPSLPPYDAEWMNVKNGSRLNQKREPPQTMRLVLDTLGMRVVFQQARKQNTCID